MWQYRTRTKTVKKPAVETGSELSTISIYFNISYSFLQFYLFLPAMLFNNHINDQDTATSWRGKWPLKLAGGLKHDCQPVSTGNVGDILFGDDSSIKKTQETAFWLKTWPSRDLVRFALRSPRGMANNRVRPPWTLGFYGFLGLWFSHGLINKTSMIIHKHHNLNQILITTVYWTPLT